MTILRTSVRTGALRSRSFRWLLAGSTVTNLGNGISPIALAFAVLDLGGSASDLGAVVGIYALADVLTVLFGGVLGDRLPRQRLMIWSSALLAITQGVVAASLVLGWGSIVILAVLGAVNGSLGALSGPSSQAMTRQTVPASDLASAITLRRLSQNTAQIVGAGLAGLAVAAFGSGWAIGIDAASFGLAAICFTGIRVAPVLAPERASMLGEVRAGLVEVFRRTWLWVLIGQALIYHLFYGGASGVLGPIVVGDSLGRPAWGWALSTMMIGFVVGGLVTLRWRPRRPLYVGTWFLTLTAAFPAAMAFSHSLTLVLLGAFLHGFGLEIFSVGWDLSIQQNVPDEMLARVYSLDQVGSFVARPIGLALTGPIAEVVGFHRWLVVVAAVMLTSTLLALTVPDVRRLQRHVVPNPVIEAVP
ncbi:MAG: major facilitator superfamily 1 [Marmoricola sp.]|nr:major facilitator superfamily 1 [Marmoricola sp.]